jgi:hypothetical protein
MTTLSRQDLGKVSLDSFFGVVARGTAGFFFSKEA